MGKDDLSEQILLAALEAMKKLMEEKGERLLIKPTAVTFMPPKAVKRTAFLLGRKN